MKILIVGSGGHGQVVAEILKRMQEAGGKVTPLGYLDDRQDLIGEELIGLRVLGGLKDLSEWDFDALVVGIGDNSLRREIYADMVSRGRRIFTAIHPTAVLASDIQIGDGSMVCAGVVVNPGSIIGEDVILNTGSVVEHHNQIDAHAHVGPGVTLGGEVTVGTGALIGVGATIMPRISIGEWSVVGAGAVVISDVPAGTTVVGVPAKTLKT